MKKIRPTIGIIGAGTTGTALAVQLFGQGYRIVSVYSLTKNSSHRLASLVNNCTVCETAQQVVNSAQAVFITTPDDTIASVAASLQWKKGQLAIHCSGAHSTDILEPARNAGAHACCLHPLQTFASIEEAIHNMCGSTFALEGDEQALPAVEEMAVALQGHIIKIKAEDKVLYHAAAVMLSNYLVTLMKTAAVLWQSFGIPQDEAVRAMLPLLKGTVNNIERIGIPGCLTGPIARGDIGTVQKHLQALEKDHAIPLEIYRLLGLQTISIALEKGRIGAEAAAGLRSVLESKNTSIVPDYEEFYRLLGIYSSGEPAGLAEK